MRLASMLRGASEREEPPEAPAPATSPRHKQRWKSALAFAKTQTRDESGPAVFSHQGPDGAWEPYDAARCLEIQAAIDAQGPDGAIQLDGIPFEVRWGSRATSSRVATPPDEGMIQVNLKNDNTRIVRRSTGPRGRVSQQRDPAVEARRDGDCPGSVGLNTVLGAMAMNRLEYTLPEPARP